MTDDNLSCAKDKFFAAAGAQYAVCPKDHQLDEKVKFIPAPTSNHDIKSNPNEKGSSQVLQETEHYWLTADTVGGK